jgi:hypothetical protein
LVSFHTATAIHQNHIALLQFLRRAAAVRKGGVLPKAAKDSTLNAKGAKSSSAITGKLVLRHAVARIINGRLVSNYRHVVSALHQRDLRRRFEHATTGSHWRRTNET